MFYLSNTTRIRFRHYIGDKKDYILTGDFNNLTPRQARGGTTCFIETKNKDGKWEVWKIGTAICSLSETNFERSVGRKIALTRALEDVEPKSLRKDIWESYFEHVRR